MEDKVKKRLKSTNLHGKEENENDKDADVRVKPHSRATETRRERGTPYFSPGEVIKQRINTLPGHQLWNNTKFKPHLQPNQKIHFKNPTKLFQDCLKESP